MGEEEERPANLYLDLSLCRAPLRLCHANARVMGH